MLSQLAGDPQLEFQVEGEWWLQAPAPRGPDDPREAHLAHIPIRKMHGARSLLLLPSACESIRPTIV